MKFHYELIDGIKSITCLYRPPSTTIQSMPPAARLFATNYTTDTQMNKYSKVNFDIDSNPIRAAHVHFTMTKFPEITSKPHASATETRTFRFHSDCVFFG